SFVRKASIKAVEALSTRFTILRSLMVAFPVAVPPPMLALATIPHDQLRTSISPLCESSCDSPLIRPCLAPLTIRNMSPEPPFRFKVTFVNLLLNVRQVMPLRQSRSQPPSPIVGGGTTSVPR